MRIGRGKNEERERKEWGLEERRLRIGKGKNEIRRGKNEDKKRED